MNVLPIPQGCQLIYCKITAGTCTTTDEQIIVAVFVRILSPVKKMFHPCGIC